MRTLLLTAVLHSLCNMATRDMRTACQAHIKGRPVTAAADHFPQHVVAQTWKEYVAISLQILAHGHALPRIDANHLLLLHPCRRAGHDGLFMQCELHSTAWKNAYFIDCMHAGIIDITPPKTLRDKQNQR